MRSSIRSRLPAGKPFALLAVLTLCACGPGQDAAAPPGEAAAPDAPPVPLVFAFQPQENPEALSPDARRLAAHLSEVLGTPTSPT